MLRLLALPLAVVALSQQTYDSSIRPLPRPLVAQLERTGNWRPSCPVAISGLRLLTVDQYGFDGRVHEDRHLEVRVDGPELPLLVGVVQDFSAGSK